MPTRRPKLQDFDQADARHRDYGGEQAMAGVGEPERQPEQHERHRMLAVLTEVGMRSQPRRTKRRERDGGSQKPGEYSQNDRHRQGITRLPTGSSADAKETWALVIGAFYRGSRPPH